MKEKLNIEQELTKYHFSTSGRVEFYQIDAMQILYNIQYLYIFETARLDYMRKIGFVNSLDDLRTKFPVFTVHNTVDYINPAYYGDEYTVYTRIAQIKNSSLKFENIILKKDGTLLAKGDTIYVYTEQSTMQSKPIPQEIKDIILLFEHNDCEIKSSIK